MERTRKEWNKEGRKTEEQLRREKRKEEDIRKKWKQRREEKGRSTKIIDANKDARI